MFVDVDQQPQTRALLDRLWDQFRLASCPSVAGHAFAGPEGRFHDIRIAVGVIGSHFPAMPEVTLIVVLATFAFVLAGLVKGVIGMGLPSISVGLISLVLSPAEAVALMLVPSLVTNLWQGLAGPHLATIVRRLWPTMIGLCAGTWLAGVTGLALLTPEAASRGRIALGATLVVYAALGLFNVRFRLRSGTEFWLGPVVGVATGVLSAATGVYMIPAVPYYQAIGLEKDALVQTQGVSYAVSTFALAVLLMSNSVLHGANAALSSAAVVPAILGMMLGQYVRGRVRPDVFRLCFYLGMLALGAHLALVHR